MPRAILKQRTTSVPQRACRAPDSKARVRAGSEASANAPQVLRDGDAHQERIACS